MANRYLVRGICASLVALAVIAMMPQTVDATHGWSNYHWRRTSSAILEVPVREYHSSVWLTRYAAAIADWRRTALTKVRLRHAFNGPANPSCPLFAGQVSSCDGFYGFTGWVGLASISVGSGGHILLGRSLVNNTYYAQSYYNNVPWRQMVICQELGHTLGLGHVNITYNTPNTGSCQDYTNDPDGGPGGVSSTDPSNMRPNSHDYALLNSRHTHIGSIIPGFEREATIPAAMMAFKPLKLSDMGTLVQVGDGGRTETYERDFGNGYKSVTFVTRAR